MKENKDHILKICEITLNHLAVLSDEDFNLQVRELIKNFTLANIEAGKIGLLNLDNKLKMPTDELLILSLADNIILIDSLIDSYNVQIEINKEKKEFNKELFTGAIEASKHLLLENMSIIAGKCFKYVHQYDRDKDCLKLSMKNLKKLAKKLGIDIDKDYVA